ncbi:MAG: triose-phosphate isomerase [Proteobacteria bacterium]|nr:MAG: triose-phosphate isomerase [Pseudomonadota bacterium]
MTSRKTILAANWKMNFLSEEAAQITEAILPDCRDSKRTEVWLAPQTLGIPAVSRVLDGAKNIRLGAQNCHWEKSGAFTGEISAPMLKEFGCTFAIVGHSERRWVFGESALTCATRAIGAVNEGLDVIFCVGETRDDREGGRTIEALREQLKPLFYESGVVEKVEQIIIAYEPVWAIGALTPAEPERIVDTHCEIADMFIKVGIKKVPPILYGGSVSTDNFAKILKLPGVAGSLIGRASWSAEGIRQLLEIAESIS